MTIQILVTKRPSFVLFFQCILVEKNFQFKHSALWSLSQQASDSLWTARSGYGVTAIDAASVLSIKEFSLGENTPAERKKVQGEPSQVSLVSQVFSLVYFAGPLYNEEYYSLKPLTLEIQSSKRLPLTAVVDCWRFAMSTVNSPLEAIRHRPSSRGPLP